MNDLFCRRCRNDPNTCTCAAETKIGLTIIVIVIAYFTITYFIQH